MRTRRCVCLLGVTWRDTWLMVSKAFSCFYPLFTGEKNIVSSRKNFFSSSRKIATTVCGQRAYGEARHTSCFTEVHAQKSCGWKLSVFINSSKKKATAFFQHFERYFFSSSRMIANTPCFSGHNVHYRRVNLKTWIRAILWTKKTRIDVTLWPRHRLT
jgi:hypothetical protein